MRIALAVAATLALAMPRPAHAADRRWTRPQIAAEATFAALVAVDVVQTRWALSHDPRYFESNPLIGDHPSRMRLSALALSAMVSHALVAHLIPTEYRSGWLAATISVEVAVLGSNFRAGARLRF